MSGRVCFIVLRRTSMGVAQFEYGSLVKTRFQNGLWYTGVFKRFAHKGKKRKDPWMLIHYSDGDVCVINPHKLKTIPISSNVNDPNSPYAVLPEYGTSFSLDRADQKVIYDPKLSHDNIVRVLS